MMVSKKKVQEDDLGQEITSPSGHLRSKQYDSECYYCVAHGYIAPASEGEK